jgi:hypothetical protein
VSPERDAAQRTQIEAGRLQVLQPSTDLRNILACDGSQGIDSSSIGMPCDSGENWRPIVTGQLGQ